MKLLHHNFTAFLCILLFTCCSSALADLSSAERLFTEGKFSESRDLYRAQFTNDEWKKLPNPAAYFFNWSLAEWKADNKAYAMAAITSAKIANPLDQETQTLFDWMNDQLNPSVKTIRPAYGSPAKLVPFDTVSSGFAILIGSLLLLISAILIRRDQRLTSASSMCLLLATLGFTFSLCLYSREHTMLAILNNDASLRSGPGASFAIIDNLALGSLVAVTQDRAGFKQLSFWRGPKESIGWATEQDLILLPTGL
jgi:hypothetical protein